METKTPLFVQRTVGHPLHDIVYIGVSVALASVLWHMEIPRIVLLAPATLLLMAWLLRAIQVEVDSHEVRIRFRTLGPTIPLETITAVSPVSYSFWRFGGWGIRISGATTLYNVVGDGGRALKIEWTTRNGHQRTTMVSSRDPEALLAAIEIARARAVAVH
jgi:hypothetical protein